jgi:hypothetical protein
MIINLFIMIFSQKLTIQLIQFLKLWVIFVIENTNNRIVLRLENSTLKIKTSNVIS